jgi:hypothetical protein
VTPGVFLPGALAIVCVFASVAIGARRACRRWFEASGSSALLVETVLALGQVYTVALLLGAVGGFRRGPVAAGCLLLGVGLSVAAGPSQPAQSRFPLTQEPTLRPGRPIDGPHPGAEHEVAVAPVEPLPRWTGAAALLATVAVTGQYLAHTLVSLRKGALDDDTLWYHAPLAAHFLQDGWTTRLYFEGGERLISYYPDNSELAASLTLLPFHRDFLLPLVNLGWLALALLSAWCLGRRYGRGPVGVAAAAVALSLPVMASRQAGTLGSDITGLALLLATVALLVESEWRGPWLALSGAAAGLAFGVKLSVMPPIAALCVALIVAAPSGRRIRSLLAWIAGAAPFALYWPIRNWARTGNPFPWLSVHLGRLTLNAVPDPGSRDGSWSVFGYLGRAGAWTRVFAPGFRIGFGPAWPLILALGVLGAGVTSFAGGSRPVRAVAVAGLVGVAAYTLIPNTVFPPPLGQYTFGDTSRYAVPAFAVGLVALSASRLLSRALVAAVVTSVLTALVVVNQVPRTLQGFGTPQWPLPATDVAAGLLIAAAGAVTWITARRLQDKVFDSRPDRLALGAPCIGVLVLLWPLQTVTTAQFGAGSNPSPANSVFAWGRHVSHSRIAVTGGYGQFPFYGPQLDNRVQFVSVPGPHGTFNEPSTCANWVQALDVGRFDYLVVYPPPAIGGVSLDRDLWVMGQPNAVLVSRFRDGRVWQLKGPLDPARCP